MTRQEIGVVGRIPNQHQSPKLLQNQIKHQNSRKPLARTHTQEEICFRLADLKERNLEKIKRTFNIERDGLFGHADNEKEKNVFV